MTQVAHETNADTIAAWNTVLFDKFARFRSDVAAMLAPHGDRALAALDARAGDCIIDLGCGFGDTTVALARMASVGGRVVGVDCAERYLEVARRELAAAPPAARRAPIELVAADLEREVPMPGGIEGYDRAYARFGTMFFAQPVVALRRIRCALRPGGRLAMAVWRRKDTNECLYATERAVRGVLGDPEKGDQVTCGPGPFSMASADLVTDQLIAAGFENIAIARSDTRAVIAEDLDTACEISLQLGPAGEVVRLAGRAAETRAAEVRAAVRAALAPFADARGRVVGATSAWIVTATAPAPWSG